MPSSGGSSLKPSSQRSASACSAPSARTSTRSSLRWTTAWPSTAASCSSWRSAVAASSPKRSGARSRPRPCAGRPPTAPSASPRWRHGRGSCCPAHTCSTTHASKPWRSSPWGTAHLSTRVRSAAAAIRRGFLNVEFTGKKLHNSGGQC